MLWIQAAFTADRQAHTVYRERKSFAKVAQLGKGPTAGTHVVFRMNFEPGHRPRILENVLKVLWLVSNPRGVRQSFK